MKNNTKIILLARIINRFSKNNDCNIGNILLHIVYFVNIIYIN